MYQVLYRKWRPQTFSDVYGQDMIVAALRGEMRTGRLAHAYLFTGSRGTGKTSCARILSKAVNCLDLRDGDPCNQCDNCVGIDSGAILDVVEIDAASNNSVGNIRELREEVGFTPAVAKYRVYIIDEAHMLTKDAFNALLKTLEEPPPHVIFILATTEVHKLTATILSRCQRFDFGRISPDAIATRIAYVSEQEDFSVTGDAAMMIARIADGGMRDALSLLDQCASGTSEITMDTVTEVAGLAGREHLFSLSAAVRGNDGAAALSLVGDLYAGSKDMERLCSEMIDFYRSLMIAKSVQKPDALIVAPPAEIARLREEAELYELAAILHAIDALRRTLERLRYGAARRTEMEMAVLRLCMPELDSDSSALLRRINVVERAVRAGAVSAEPPLQDSAPVQVSVPVKEPVSATPVPAPVVVASAPVALPKNAPPVSPSEPEVELPFTAWEDVLEVLAETCKPIFGVLQDSGAVLRGDHMLITTDNALFRTLIKEDANRAALSAAIRSSTGRSYRVGIKRPEPPTVPVDDKPGDPLSALLDNSRSYGVEITEK